MEYGQLRRMFSFSITALIYLIWDFKYVECQHKTFEYREYYPINNQICPVRSCIPTSLVEPERLWEIFPCPPPSKPELLSKLDWEGRLGAEGIRIKNSIALRCGIDLLQSPMLESSDSAQSLLFFLNCDANCVVAVVAVSICLLIVFCVFVVIKRLRLHVGWTKSARMSKTNGRNGALRDNRLYMRSPPNSGQFINTSNTESVIGDNGVEIRLLKTKIDDGNEKSVLSRYYDQINGSQKSSKTSGGNGNYDKTANDPTEDTSITYSGTDTTHTYESVRGSINSDSIRLVGSPSAFTEQPKYCEAWGQGYTLSSQSTLPCTCVEQRWNDRSGYSEDVYAGYPVQFTDGNTTCPGYIPHGGVKMPQHIGSDMEATQRQNNPQAKTKQGKKRRKSSSKDKNTNNPIITGSKPPISGYPPCGCRQCSNLQMLPQEHLKSTDSHIYQTPDLKYQPAVGRHGEMGLVTYQTGSDKYPVNIYPCDCVHRPMYHYNTFQGAMRYNPPPSLPPPPPCPHSPHLDHNEKGAKSVCPSSEQYEHVCNCHRLSEENQNFYGRHSPVACNCDNCKKQDVRQTFDTVHNWRGDDSDTGLEETAMLSDQYVFSDDSSSRHKRTSHRSGSTLSRDSSFSDSANDRPYRGRLPKTNGSLYKPSFSSNR